MKKCKQCGKPCKRTWCSQKCNAESRKKGATFTCQNCGTPFYLRPSEIEKGGGKHCTDNCRREREAREATWYLKKGTKPIHRIVAENKLGRKLKKGEAVHHIDGNIHNNHPDNLMVFPSHSEHMKHEFDSGKISVSHEQAVENGRLSGIARRRESKNR